MKLVIVSPYGTYPEHNNGPPIVIYNLLKNWSPLVDEIHLFTGCKKSKTTPPIYNQYKNLQVYIISRDWDRAETSIDNSNYASSFKMIFELLLRAPAQSYRIFRKIDEINPDIVFYNILPMDPSAILPFLLKIKNFKQIARIPVFHPLEFRDKCKNYFIFKMMSLLYKLMLLNMDCIITQSPEVKKELCDNIKERIPVMIIPNGTELLSPRVDQQSQSVAINVLFTGRISKDKGIETLLEAIDYLNNEIINKITILLIGPGWEDYVKYIRNIIKNKDLEKIIQILGEVPHDQLSEYYQISDIYVFPSFREGMPNSVLEAMGAGLPIIASNIEANKNLIEDGKNGILFEVGNPAELAAALEELIENEILRKKIGKNAYESVKSKSWRRISEDYLLIFKEITNKDVF